jgi:excisionase family DNA binding protein
MARPKRNRQGKRVKRKQSRSNATSPRGDQAGTRRQGGESASPDVIDHGIDSEDTYNVYCRKVPRRELASRRMTESDAESGNGGAFSNTPPSTRQPRKTVKVPDAFCSKVAGSSNTPPSNRTNPKNVTVQDTGCSNMTETKPVATVRTSSRFYRITDLMRILDVSRSTIERMLRSGRIPGRVKVGGQLRFSRLLVDQWIDRMVAEGGA